MSSKGRDNTISPVRAKSRLKKRRRQQKETNNEGNAAGVICSLQHLSHASSKQTSGHKENSLNGLPSASVRLTVGKGLGNVSSLLHQQQSTQPSRHCPGLGEHSHESSSWQVYTDDDPIPNNNDYDTKNTPQRLAFIEKIDQSTLISAIPRILGIDLTRFDTSSSTFQSELERAFAYNAKGGSSPHDKDNQKYRLESRNAIYHSLVGRIDPHSKSCPVDMMGEYASIAFPSCSTKSNLDVANNPQNGFINKYDPFQHLNLRRRTEFGMIVPLSWYQFPDSSTTSKNKPASHKGGTLTNASEGGQSTNNSVIEDRQLAQKVPPTEDFHLADWQEEQAKPTAEYKMAEHTHAQKHPSHEQARVNTENSVQSSQHGAAIQRPIQYQGKLKIISDKGATIREVFDIDNSNHVLGKLHMGDTRYYLEKKTLLPPPICLDGSDEDEEESDDECVAVVRYKIVLEPSDCVGGQFAERLPTGEMVGWISDRSRLADDSFLILKVL